MFNQDSFDEIVNKSQILFLNAVSNKYKINSQELLQHLSGSNFDNNIISKKDNRCCARIFSGGNGDRCSKNKIVDSDFCKCHHKENLNNSLKYNRFDEEPPQKNKKMYENWKKQIKEDSSYDSSDNNEIDDSSDDTDEEDKSYHKKGNLSKNTDGLSDDEEGLSDDKEGLSDDEEGLSDDEEGLSDDYVEFQCQKIEIDSKPYLVDINDTKNVYSIDGDNEFLGRFINGKIDTNYSEF